MAGITPKPAIGAAGKKADGLAADVSGKYDDASPSRLRDQLRKEGGSGKSPDSNVRDRLAGPLGADVGSARFHTGPAAAAAARQLQASAFTIGQDVFFGAGKYDPTTAKGMGLIAHEATHTVQQAGARGNTTRHHTQQGGDAMEQEAEEMAQLVLVDQGKGESLQVGEYVRNYASEGGDGIAPADQARLDRIAVLALKHAQAELAKGPRRSIPGMGELVVDVDLDLTELSDEDAARVWGDAIVEAVKALKRSPTAVKPTVQRAPVTSPNASVPPQSSSVVSVKVAVTVHSPDLQGKGTGTIVVSASAEETYASLREIGMEHMAKMEVIVAQLAQWAAANPENAAPGATPVLPPGTENPNAGDAAFEEKLAAALPAFKKHIQAFDKGWKDFQEDFKKRGTLATLALIAEARNRTEDQLKKLGIQRKAGEDYDAPVASYSSASDSMKKLSARAMQLRAKQAELDVWLKKVEDKNGFFHWAFNSAESLKKEEDEIFEKMPIARKAYEQDRAEAEGEFPILTHFKTTAQLDNLKDAGLAAQATGEKFYEILRNLDDLEANLKASNSRVLALQDHLEPLMKGMGLTPFERATVLHMRQKETEASELTQKILALMAIVVGAIAAAPTGGGSLVMAAALAEAGINTALLLQAFSDYSLQKAAATSDPDAARSLSKEEPSLFWLALQVVGTLAGMKGNADVFLREASAIYNEVRIAYKTAAATGETGGLKAVLQRAKFPAEAAEGVIARALKESVAIVEGIVKQGPEGVRAALDMLKTSPNFYGVRLAVWRLKANTAVAQGNLQAARQQILNKVLEEYKGKYPKIKFQTIDQGFQKPIVVRIVPAEPMPPPPASTVKPASAPAGPPSAALPDLPADVDKTPVKSLPPGLLAEAKGSPGASPKPAQSALAGSVPAPPPRAPLANAGGAPPGPIAGGGPPAPIAGPGGTPKNTGWQPPMKVPEPIDQAFGAAVDLQVVPHGDTGGPVFTGLDLRVEMDPSVAPVGYMAPEVYEHWGIASGSANVKMPGYRGIYLSANPSQLEKDAQLTQMLKAEGSSAKVVFRDLRSPDQANPRMWLFKPAGGEARISEAYKVDAGTYYVRGRMAYDIATEMPSIGEHALPFSVVVYDGQVGSLQPFIRNTKSIKSLKDNDYALYKKIWEEHPEVAKFRANLEVYDYIINNPDRNPGNFLVEFHDDGTFKRIYAIDQDAALTPGARTVLVPTREKVPRQVSTTFTGVQTPLGTQEHLGKISHAMYEEMLRLKANQASVGESWRMLYGVDQSVVDGVFMRLDEVLTDYADRIATNPNGVFLD